MLNEEDRKKIKKLAEEYKFSALKKLSRVQLELVYKELYALIRQLEIENGLLKNEINELNEKLKNKIKRTDYVDYDPKAKGIDKVIFILQQNSKLMLSSEIVRELLIAEPTLKQKWADPYACVIKYISRGVGFSRIIQYTKIGSGGFTYGLPEWFDEGLLIPKYRYDK